MAINSDANNLGSFDSHLPSTIISKRDGISMIMIPASDFLMGINKDQVEMILELLNSWVQAGYFHPNVIDTARENLNLEMPQQQVYVDAFFIDQIEVTNRAYELFCKETGYKTPPHWSNGIITPGTEYYPVTHVSWYDTQSYAQWAGKRLPNETEWEKAARGTDGRLFPWGNEFDYSKVHYARAYSPTEWTPKLKDMISSREKLARVDNYPGGASPYGVLDMLGNVGEWVNDFTVDDSHAKNYSVDSSELTNREFRVVKGCASLHDPEYLRCSYRSYVTPTSATDDIGFRCALTADKKVIRQV